MSTKETTVVYDEIEIFMEGDSVIEVETANSGVHRKLELSEDAVRNLHKQELGKSWLYDLI